MRTLLILVVVLAGLAGAFLSVHLRPAPGPKVADVLRPLADVATARVELRSLQRGTTTTRGRLVDNTDEVLVAAAIRGDLGIPLADLTPDRWHLVDGTLVVRLPPPRLLPPGLTLDPVATRDLEMRTTRWPWTRRFSDPGPGQAAARAAAQRNALEQAPAVIDRLGLAQDLRETTRRTVTTLLPRLLGRPGLPVTVVFDDERSNG